MEYDKKKVVILGGGYAGLMTAVTLQKKVHPSRIEIFLVNNNDYHYITTKVHEAGAGTVNPESIKLPIHQLIDSERVTHELKKSIPVLCKQYEVDPNDVHLIVVEPNEEILQGYPDSIVIDAEKSLKNICCEFKIGVAVTTVEKDRVILQDGKEIPTKMFIWAGGVEGHPLLGKFGFELLDGRVKLNEYCEVPDYHDIYVLGDASVSFSEKGEPYPPTAQIAIQQGQYCAYNIAMKIYGQSIKPFHYIFRGTVMSLGKGNASGIVYDHHISGHLASFMKWVIEMRYYFMLGGIHLIRKQWKHS